MLFFGEERTPDSVIDGDVGPQPWVILDVVNFNPLAGVYLKHFRNQVLGSGAELVGHMIDALYIIVGNYFRFSYREAL